MEENDDVALEEALYQLRNEIRKHAHEHCPYRCAGCLEFEHLLLEVNDLLDDYYRRLGRVREYGFHSLGGTTLRDTKAVGTTSIPAPPPVVPQVKIIGKEWRAPRHR